MDGFCFATIAQAVMNLLAIIAATLVAGIGSVWIAALLLRVGVRSGAGGVNPQHLLSLAAGALLATAFMHLLPEAFESHIAPAVLFGVLLFGLVFFFLLDKAELWHHGHEHHHGEHVDEHGHAVPMRTVTAITTPTPTTMRMRTTPRAAAGPCSPATAFIASATAS